MCVGGRGGSQPDRLRRASMGQGPLKSCCEKLCFTSFQLSTVSGRAGL